MAAMVAADLPDGALVNLGIGMPSLVAAHLPPHRGVLLHAEHGIIGLGPPATPASADPDVIDAGKIPATLVVGAAIVDHLASFALIRGGRLDIGVLGAFQISERGDLANWLVPGQALGSVGGAMDIAVGAKRIFALMRHVDKQGQPKLVTACTYPLTAEGCVDRVYTDLAVVDVVGGHFVVRELAPGITQERLRAATGAPLRFS